jgi:hypothetical protein
MDLRETGGGSVDWIDLTQDMDNTNKNTVGFFSNPEGILL